MEPATKRRKLSKDTSAIVTSHLTPQTITVSLLSSLTDLPKEIVHHICSFLTVRDKFSLYSVNKQLRSFCSDPYIWTHVNIEYANHPVNSNYIKAVLKLSQPNIRYLSIKGTSEGTALPFRQYQSMIFKCTNIHSLCLYGFNVNTLKAVQNIVTSLPHLQQLVLPYSKEDIVQALPLLSHLKKLVITVKDKKRITRHLSSHVEQIYNVWRENCKCLPPQMVMVGFPYYSGDRLPDIPPTITHSACFYVYERYQRPLNLPFYDQPQCLKCSNDFHVGETTLPYRDVEISLHRIITPSINDPPDMGLYATVTRMDFNTQLPSYSLHGANVTVLCLNNAISAECFIDIIELTPNLQEIQNLTERNFSSQNDLTIHEYLYPLPKYCKELKGLDLSGLSWSYNNWNDFQIMWPYLSKIESLEYLGINIKAFIPPWSGQKKVYASSPPAEMIDSMKSMLKLKALHLQKVNMIMLNTDQQTSQLISQNLLPIILNFPSLCYVFGRAPNKSQKFTDLLQSWPVHKLSDLTADPTLCQHLTNLVKCSEQVCTGLFRK